MALLSIGVDGQAPTAILWQVDNLQRIGGLPVEAIGAPSVVQTEVGPAISFNGRSDGLLIERNPLAGLARFTLEVLFSPDADGPAEQRFLHLQEAGTENRAMVELRLAEKQWSLDTYLQHGKSQLALLDRAKTHAAGDWHVASLTFDGKTMAHYVDGVRDGGGDVAFLPLSEGQTSIGVRQNRLFWFKGRIRTIRVTPSVLSPSAFLAVPPKVIALWPEGVPGAKPPTPEVEADGRISNVHVPTLTYYPPSAGTANGTAMIVCAGGSYARLAMANEVAGITPLLTGRGVSVFVLKYRLLEYGHPAPLQDVLRAVRLVRSKATAFGIRPDRIGIFGASAGGHLAASAATLYDSADGRTGAELDRVSARPDFVALLYPVITMKPPYAHDLSRRNLLGDKPSATLVDRLSIETRVSKNTPPMFIVHTAEDRSVPIENSMMLARALRDAAVPVETHFYERGAHGFGVSPGLGATSEWPKRLDEWMTAHGWIGPGGLAASNTWARGVEGQRKADLGNGYYLNPILPGDHPDPSILKEGADYYMTFSSFDAYPGLVIWHSRDLVNWQPVGPALFKNVGAVWAPDLVKHKGRYFIYFPGVGPYRSNYVIWADNIRGPWSEPIDLKIGRIDPGHAIGPDGKRYLFLSGGYLAPLADDGLSVTGEVKKVYDGWQYPADWIVEGFAPEGPKVISKGDYYYMVLAEGGTAGPPTGHMIVAARSKSIEGPWENSPYNPIIRTQSASEHWWSKGHGTLVEAADGRWFIVYHGYENGFYNLGRQTLLEPIEWTADGWFRTATLDPAQPIAKPAGEAVANGFAYSDDFSSNRMGLQWSFYKGTETDRERYRYENKSLVLKGRGKSPADSSPLWFVTGDQAYEIEVEIDADPGATAGLLLFYNQRLYAGLGYSATNFIMHSYGLDRPQAKPAHIGRTLHLRLRNDRHIVTIDYSVDGQHWDRYDRGMEVSGYHHNVGYDFLSLRPALYAAGTGEVRFRNFKYRALP
ncbi:MAG: family 43 glycosylhydrolase [Vicinamibacterales bacterium]